MTSRSIAYIVDDDPAARDSLAALLYSKGVDAELFSSGEDFLQNYRPGAAACLITDLRMPGISGLELQRALNERQISLPVIMITGFGDVPTAVKAMRAGAFTFLEKPCRADELWEAVREALSASAQRQLDESRIADLKSRLALLGPDERRVMQLMLAGKTNKAIAAEMDAGLRTIELRRANILKKMQATTSADLVRMLLAIGELPEEPAE